MSDLLLLGGSRVLLALVSVILFAPVLVVSFMVYVPLLLTMPPRRRTPPPPRAKSHLYVTIPTSYETLLRQCCSTLLPTQIPMNNLPLSMHLYSTNTYSNLTILLYHISTAYHPPISSYDLSERTQKMQVIIFGIAHGTAYRYSV
jgi:hypothetical protein